MHKLQKCILVFGYFSIKNWQVHSSKRILSQCPSIGASNKLLGQDVTASIILRIINLQHNNCLYNVYSVQCTVYHIAFKIPSTKKPVNKVEWKWKKNWMQAIVWSLKTPLKLFKMWVCNSIFIQIIIIQMSGWTRSVEFDYSISMEVDNNAIVWWILKCVALHCSELDHVIDWMRHYELSAANWQLSNIVPFRLCHWPMATCFCFYFKIQQLFLSVAFAAQERICACCQMWYQAMPCHVIT